MSKCNQATQDKKEKEFAEEIRDKEQEYFECTMSPDCPCSDCQAENVKMD